MTITKNVSNYNDVLLDKQTQFGTISQQPTANSQQPTANSQQPTANSQQPTANSQQPTANSQQPTSNFYSNNFIFRYIYFANKSNLGFYSVAALFLCLFGQGVQKITN